MAATELLTIKDLEAIKQKMVEAVDRIIPREVVRMRVSEWAESRRVLTNALTPYPGPFSFDPFPFMREIADALSPTSPIQEIAVMKGTQIAATVGLGENYIGFTIDADPAPMLYVTGDAAMADQQMELRVDAMINSSGIADKIGSQSKRRTQRKSGDIKSRKEFTGGFLIAAGPNSGAKLRSMSFQKIYADEIDSWKQSTGKEGDPIELIRRRTDAFSETYKILWTSTPLIDHTSHVKRLFEQGDQRKYFVPCKHCGHMQYLKWSQIKFDKDENDFLIYEADDEGRVTWSSVHYECEQCGGAWQNEDKDWFLPRGEWRATARANRPGMRSYHIPGLLSPKGFRDWTSGVLQFLECKREGYPPEKYQNWVNTFLGETWINEGERPRVEALITRTRRYHVGTIPEDATPIFVTIGADVQADRIEAEVVAWGRNKESWSIGYHVMHGETDDLDSNAWSGLTELINAEHAGMPVLLAGVDAGYRTDVVYDFADSFEAGVHPVMGYETIGKGRDYIKPYTVEGRQTARIDLNTDLLKQEIYRYLNKAQYESGKYPAGFMHLPAEYGREHINRLTAETRIEANNSNGYKWEAGGRRNEQLDCRVYALGMVYAYKYSIEEMHDSQITWEEFWDYVAGTDEE